MAAAANLQRRPIIVDLLLLGYFKYPISGYVTRQRGKDGSNGTCKSSLSMWCCLCFRSCHNIIVIRAGEFHQPRDESPLLGTATRHNASFSDDKVHSYGKADVRAPQ